MVTAHTSVIPYHIIVTSFYVLITVDNRGRLITDVTIKSPSIWLLSSVKLSKMLMSVDFQ